MIDKFKRRFNQSRRESISQLINQSRRESISNENK